MDTKDKQEILQLLTNGRQAFLDSVSGMTDQEAAAAPGEGRWSVLQIAEHIGLVEARLLVLIRQAVPAAELPDVTIAPHRENLIRERASDPSRKVSAPELSHPQNRFSTLADAIAQFDRERAQSLAFIEAYEHDPRTRIAQHPVLGPANCMEMMLMIGNHPLRHSRQVLALRDVRGGGRADTQVAS